MAIKYRYSVYNDYPGATNISRTYALLSGAIFPLSFAGAFFISLLLSKIFPSLGESSIATIIVFLALLVAIAYFGTKLLAVAENNAIQSEIERANREYAEQPILYCPKCNSTYSDSKNGKNTTCPECHNTLMKTDISKLKWIRFDEKGKNLHRELWRAQAEMNRRKQLQQAQGISAADEIRKYKELFDAGILTQEEFDKKKKQLLGI